MQRIALLLLGLASLVAGGVITGGRGRVGLHAMGGIGLQTVQGMRGGYGGGNVLTTDELVRQKFILDILYQVYTPLQQQDLLMLDDVSIITNENLYVRPLTQEMQMVLNLIANKQLLSKQVVFNVNNEQHMCQFVGFYKLLVNAGDFDTFKRLVVHARQYLNTATFVNALVVALGERQDTQMLIVPALQEILPQLFVKDHIIDQIQQLDTGVTGASIKPQLIDVIGIGHRNMLWNSQISDQQQQQGGVWDVLNRSQLWMPWRQLHKQIALRKMMGGNVVQQEGSQMDKLIVSLPGNGLLTQDMSLKSYVAMLIDELLVNQNIVGNVNKNYNGINSQVYGTWGTRGGKGQIGWDDIVGGMQGNRVYGNINSQYGTNMQEGINTDRLLYVGRHSRNNDFGVTDDVNINGGIRHSMGMGMDVNKNRGIYGGSRYGNVVDEDDMLSSQGRLYKNRYDIDDGINMDRNTYMGRQGYVQEGQRGINTVSANDARLLFVGRRRKNPNSVVDAGNNRYYNDYDELISGGRRVYNDRYTVQNQKNKYNDNDDEVTIDDIKRMNSQQWYTNDNRRGIMVDNDENDLLFNKYRGIVAQVNYRDNGQNQQTYEYDNVNSQYQGQGQGQGMGYGHGREDFLSIVKPGYMGQRQSYDNDQDLMWNQGSAGQYSGYSLDMQLPTTSINDERLLHINRHKLNNIEEGRHVVVDDDNERYDSGYQSNWGQNNWDTIRRDNQNQNGQIGERNNRGKEHHGHRHRRSIVNQDLTQTNNNNINGKLIVHTLQQLVARLNTERIALGQSQLIDVTTQKNIARGVLTNNLVYGVDVQTVNKIHNIIQQIDNILQQQIGQITVSTYNQKMNEIGLILAGQIQDIGLIDMLAEVMQQTNQQQRKGPLVNVIENEAMQVLLAGIVKVIDNHVQQMSSQRQGFISTVQGVSIDNIEVDKFQTYLEQTEVDLTNLLNNNNNKEQIGQGIYNNNKVLVGRVPRLNHKSFKIEIDVTSDRQQQVVVRNLLVPKVDGYNNIIPLVQRQQNVIVLDVTTAQLQQGQNTLKIKSNDITLTSRDTTPLTKIYQLVMQALNGDIMLQQDLLAGQTTLLPHHLLLPRGRSNGLPMHLVTVITPLQQGTSSMMGKQQGAGLNTLLLDNLPLNYPLHCDITDLEKVISMPNLMVKDVNIYHDDNIQMHLQNMY